MAMVVVDASCLKQEDSQPKSCGLVWGSAAASPDEQSELSQWPGHDDSTINIVVVIIIIIIIITGALPLQNVSKALHLY